MLERLIAAVNRRLQAMLADPVRGLVASLGALAVLMAVGTFGYMLLEQMEIIEALYMTVITISTVGFGEVRPLSPPGRIFTSVLILLGLALATSALSNAASIMVGPRLWFSIKERRMNDTVETISDHYIVCGYGRMGEQIVTDLLARKEPFVVVDSNPDIHNMLVMQDVLHVIGDATIDETLREAGVERAVGLVSALDTDPDNLMTVLSAREINPKLFIVARSTSPSTDRKLRRAGADRVVSPYQIGGHRMALALLRPAVHDLMSRIFNVTDSSKVDMDLGQVRISDDSHLAGRSIADTNLRRTHNVSIIAVQSVDGELIINPNIDHVLHVGDVLVVIGPPEAIQRMHEKLKT